MNVLTIDIGGSRIKALATGQTVARRVDSGPTMTAMNMVELVKEMCADWSYAAISIGYPGVVIDNQITAEPRHLGPGWRGFDFAAAFGKPVKLVNDAAMQALGNYEQGRMLFLGLGTGLGTAMVIDGSLAPMELAHLPYRRGRSFEEYVGAQGYARLGKRKWRRHVWAVVELLRNALQVPDVVIGGGNSKKLKLPPDGVRLADNAAAFKGGERLWGDLKNLVVLPSPSDAQQSSGSP